jgi:hypothetical protein
MLSLVIALAFAKNGSAIEWNSEQIPSINREHLLSPYQSTPDPFHISRKPSLGRMSQGSFGAHASGWEV